jgi:hypothetical protein
MRMQTIELKTAPEVKRIVTAAFPGYKKHKAYLSVFYSGQSINSYWDGGSKDEYAIVDLSSYRRGVLPTSSHPYFDVARNGLADQSNQFVDVDHVGNVHLKVLPEGYALVRAGTFCGRPLTAHVFLSEANIAKLLAA